MPLHDRLTIAELFEDAAEFFTQAEIRQAFEEEAAAARAERESGSPRTAERLFPQEAKPI